MGGSDRKMAQGSGYQPMLRENRLPDFAHAGSSQGHREHRFQRSSCTVQTSNMQLTPIRPTGTCLPKHLPVFLFILTANPSFFKIKLMSKLLKKRFLILVVVTLLLASMIIFLVNKGGIKTSDSKQSIYQPTGTDNKKVVTRDPKLHADNTDQFRIEYGKIRTLLPYEASGVRLTYDESLGFITARIKDVKTEEDFLAKKLTVENFLKSKGVDDLCGLAITWFPPESLKLPVKDSLSPNCTF